MSKGVHNIVFYVSPDPECSRTTQNSEISLVPSRGHILYAIYGNSTCVINHIVVTAIDKRYRNYYISTLSSVLGPLSGVTALVVTALVVPRMEGKGTLMGLEVDRHREVTANSKEMVRNQKPNQVQVR